MKISLIVIGALAASFLCRRRSAALRHWILAAAVAAAALLPLFEAVVPAWTLPFAAPAAFESDAAAPAVTNATAATRGESPAKSPSQTALPSAGLAADSGMHIDLVPALWIAGVVFSLALLGTGMLRLTWLALRARPVLDGRWLAMMQEISSAYGLRRPIVLLQSDHPSLLVTWGLVQPKVILPSSADTWSDERARVVLSHELAHISRGDWIVQIAAEVLRAFYWFNPILWIACRRLRLESEHACDDEVMSRGVAGTDYAGHLVELARALNRQRHPWCPAPAMARPSSLERRVRAMLTNGINRRPLGGTARAGVFALCLFVSAAVAAAQSGFVTFSGRVADEQGRGVPGTAVTLSNDARQSKYEVKSNADGHFEFVGLPAGDYGIDIKGIGFESIKDVLTVQGQNLRRSFTLKLGSLQETVTVKFDPTSAAGAADAPVIKEGRVPAAPRECRASPAGGNIQAPRKIRDASPTYPKSLQGTGTEGSVVMLARIGVDGYSNDISLVGDANPDLAHAAIAAVREWRYTQTLLNCQPVEVMMTVTVNFQRMPPLPPPPPPRP